MSLILFVLVLLLIIGLIDHKDTPPAPPDDEFQPFENENKDDETPKN